MRNELKKKKNQRLKFTGVVKKFGQKRTFTGFSEPTICISDIKFEDGQPATTHVWFTIGKGISAINLVEGDVICFEARISTYTKGYVNYRDYIDNRETDFKLNYPTKIKKQK